MRSVRISTEGGASPKRRPKRKTRSPGSYAVSGLCADPGDLLTRNILTSQVVSGNLVSRVILKGPSSKSFSHAPLHASRQLSSGRFFNLGARSIWQSVYSITITPSRRLTSRTSTFPANQPVMLTTFSNKKTVILPESLFNRSDIRAGFVRMNSLCVRIIFFIESTTGPNASLI